MTKLSVQIDVKCGIYTGAQKSNSNVQREHIVFLELFSPTNLYKYALSEEYVYREAQKSFEFTKKISMDIFITINQIILLE